MHFLTPKLYLEQAFLSPPTYLRTRAKAAIAILLDQIDANLLSEIEVFPKEADRLFISYI